MAKRSFVKRRGSSKLLTAAAANRKFAKKQLDWINLFNTTCEVRSQEPSEEDLCPSQLVIPLMNASQVAALDEQNVTIRRLLGHLYFRPTAPAGIDPADVEGMTCYMRLGLKRFQIPSGAQDPLAFLWNPLRGLDITEGADEDEIGDFTDGNFMHQWEALWAARSYRDLHTNVSGYWQPRLELCGVGTLACVEPQQLNDGSGYTWGAGPTGSEHVPIKLGGVWHPCPDSQCETPGETNGYNTWDWKHFAIDMRFKRGLTLKGEDYLALFGGFENLAIPQGTRPPQPTMYYFGGLRALVER